LCGNPKFAAIFNRLRELKSNTRIGTVVADPWGVLNPKLQHRFGRAELAQLPIGELTGAAHLYMVCPHNRICDGAALVEVWGYVQATSLVVVGPTVTRDEVCWKPAHYLVLVGSRGQEAFTTSGLFSWLEGNGNGFHVEQIKLRIREASPATFLQLFGTNSSSDRDWIVVE
jgi:hypothetical protein